MPVAFPPLVKRLQTDPADMRPAVPTLDMVAPVALLNRDSTTGAILHAVRVLPLPGPKFVVALGADALVGVAVHAVVGGDLAGGADGGQAGRAGDDDAAGGGGVGGRGGGDAVDLLAVGRGAVLEALGVGTDVRGEGVFEQLFEHVGR